MADTGYDDWEPPSETTMKLLEACRERSDRISKLMGDYLLKGYKMLGTTCPQCDTILMQTKQGTNYCIACSELDSDADKDDPVTNQVAALAQAREREVRESPPRPTASQPSNPLSHPSSSQPSERRIEVTSTNITSDHPFSSSLQHPFVGSCVQAMDSSANASCRATGHVQESERYVKDLLDKMDWATVELRGTQSVEYSIQLCQLIKSCADAVCSVKVALKS